MEFELETLLKSNDLQLKVQFVKGIISVLEYYKNENENLQKQIKELKEYIKEEKNG